MSSGSEELGNRHKGNSYGWNDSPFITVNIARKRV